MPIINVNFARCPTIKISVDPTDIGIQYFNLVKENYNREQPIYRDINKYTFDYLKSLAVEASEVLGWDWIVDNYTIENKAIFHKDIELLLGNTGFDQIPHEYDNLLHELHYGLHVYKLDKNQKRGGWLQIEWYNDDGFELDYSFEFQPELKFGDIKLQNPFVGHGPLQMYYEQDFINISQTCKFQTFVKPGINISTDRFEKITFKDKIIELFQLHDPDFVELHGVEKIKHYTGYPVIGRVINLNDLYACLKTHILELDSLTFEYD